MLKATDRGVSPIIGIVLMVAITVLLAAVVGAFALPMVNGTDSPPQTRLSAEEHPSDKKIIIYHEGGEPLKEDQLTAVGSEIEVDSADTGDNKKIEAGESITVLEKSSGSLEKGDKIKLRWDSNKNSQSTLLLEYTLSDDWESK